MLCVSVLRVCAECYVCISAGCMSAVFTRVMFACAVCLLCVHLCYVCVCVVHAPVAEYVLCCVSVCVSAVCTPVLCELDLVPIDCVCLSWVSTRAPFSLCLHRCVLLLKRRQEPGTVGPISWPLWGSPLS